MKTITSICPGCSIGCGCYLVESEEGEEKTLKVAHRMVAPTNEGKLCKFGMHLPTYYDKEALHNSVDGTDVEQDKAIQTAKERLKSVKPDELAFIALPRTVTNEEIVSLLSLASTIGCENISFGFERFFRGIPEDAFYVVENGLPFTDIEEASKIVLFFVDPFVHYPLIARRILKAKENGAQIIEFSFAKNERGIADESIVVEPWEVESIKERRELFEDSLIISELTPYTNPYLLSLVFWLQTAISSRLLLLKPFLNATGALLLGKNLTKGAGIRKDLFEILDRIDRGEIKGLYLFETDLTGALLGGEEVTKTLSKLDVLIEQNAFRTPVSEIADITLCSEPFYMKKGTIVNIEGRVLELGGGSANGLWILESLDKGRTYGDVHEEVKRLLGLDELSEFEIAVTREEKKFEVPLLMDFTKTFLSLLGIEEEKERREEAEYFLWYKTNPFFWSGIRDKQFVEISPAAMRALGLLTGDAVEIAQDDRREKREFKISDLPDYLIVSEDKLAIQPLDGRWTEPQRRAKMTNVAMKRAR